MLKENNINTHFIKSLSDREMLVKSRDFTIRSNSKKYCCWFYL